MTRDRVHEARMLARFLHSNQVYGEAGDHEYHVNRVVENIHRFGFGHDEDLVVAAWLHDVVEDTQAKIKMIEEYFGPRVKKIVWAVTNESGENRKERHTRTYPKLMADQEALTVKLADRIANIEYSLEVGSNKLDMYKKEHYGFYSFLYVKNHNEEMWNHLNKLIGFEP